MKFDFNTPMGIAGGVFLAGMLDGDKMPAFWQDLDPKMKAAALVFAGDWLPKQKFVKGAIKSGPMRDGAGAGLQAMGIQQLLQEFDVIQGIGQSQLRDDDILAVAIEGDDYYDDDLDVVNDDVLADDDYDDDDDDDDDDDMWD